MCFRIVRMVHAENGFFVLVAAAEEIQEAVPYVS